MKEKITKITTYLKENAKIIVITSVSTFAVIFITITGEHITSTTSFCTSCHSMSYPAEELKSSVHFKRLGFEPECGACHMPVNFVHRLYVHTVSGIKDTFKTMTTDFSTLEKFNEHRPRLAKKALADLKSWDSSPCRKCHSGTPGDKDTYKYKMHENILAKNEKTCVDCHSGIFHAKP